MKLSIGFVLGFAAGVLALGGYLYSSGRIVSARPVVSAEARPAVPAEAAEAAKLPEPAPMNTAIPAPAETPLPNPPEMPVPAAGAADKVAPSNGVSDSVSLGLPLAGMKKESIQDTFNDTRGGGTKHEATDIMAPRGTPVHAVVEGNVVKLFQSKKGGTTVYQFDNQQKYCYYYAHLDRYTDGLKEGMLLRKGDTLGYVGSTGDAQAANPHLHLAILKLGPDKHYYEHTTAIDPYPLLVQALPSK